MGNSPEAISKPVNSFANDLFKVISESSEGNVFFSPFSIAATIAMLHMGSKGNTEKQIMTGMHLPQDKELIKKAFHDVLSNYKSFWNPYQLHTSNLIYIQERFQVKDDFLNSLKYFLTSIKRVNFGEAEKVAKEINKIVEKETKSKITNIVSPDNFNADTLLVLVNAIYFKANWDVKLKIEDASYQFLNSGSQPVDVEMMYKKSKYRWQPDLKDLKAKLLALDYKGSRMCFVILLPNEMDGLGNLEEKLKSVDLGELDRDAVSTKVKLYLPKFKLEESVNLNSVLQNLGMIDMFNEEICDLSGISSAPEAYVSDVIHKAFLDVTEVGCEAAAATVNEFDTKKGLDIDRTPAFVVNHPFIFYIKDRKFNNILFMGKVTQL